MQSGEKKRVVVVGGGNGSACSLNALKQYRNIYDISAVVSVSDSGGSSGRLRKEFGTLPMGDILRAVLAMSPYPYKMLKHVFNQNRFEETGKLDGHNLGNMFLVLAEQYDGDFEHALRALHQAVEAVGTVHPVTREISDLCVELSNGDIIIGEHEIDRPLYDRSLRIKRAWLQPTPALDEGAKQAIEHADAIVFGPGSLYCSIIATLAVEGMQKEVVRSSRAQLIYVIGNSFETHGETGPTSVSDAIHELEAFLPRPLDAIIYNNHRLTKKEEEHYKERGWSPLEFDFHAQHEPRLITADYEKDPKDGAGLSPQKLGRVLHDVIAE